MNLQHIRYFITLANVKNYHQAAADLYITQPALSKAMQKLEDELQNPLFVKTGTTLQLTKFGKIFYNYAKDSLAVLDEGIEHVQAISEKEQHLIRVGSIGSCATQCVPLSFATFKSEDSALQFVCMEMDSEQILKRLIDGDLDIGLISSEPDHSIYQSLSVARLFAHQVLIAVPENHPFMQRNEVRYEELLHEPFIYYPPESGNRISLQEQLRNYNKKEPDNIVVYSNSEESMLALVRNGLGLAMVSNTAFHRILPIHFVSLSDVYLSFPVYIVWRTGIAVSGAVQAYKEFVLRAHRDHEFIHGTASSAAKAAE